MTTATGTERRDDIVAALATVPGLSPSPTTPSVITAGAAWPVWASSTWVTIGYWRTLWYVFVALENSDAETTTMAGDPLVDLVGQALAAAGLGGLVVEPWSWAMDENRSRTVPVLRFTALD
jgi:hypothetical protein